jgi:hypothetical protein
MQMQGTPQQNPMNAYFTQLADPRYRKAMQQQNLFSNLLNFGAQMSAAGAPSLDPGYAARTRAGALAGLGKGLMSGNQAHQNQLIQAIKLKQLMRQNEIAQAKRKNIQSYAETFPEGSRSRAAALAGVKPPEEGKFGGFTVIADPKSSTGYYRVQINQQGDTRIVGEAPEPASTQFLPYVPPKQPARKTDDVTGEPSRFNVGNFGVPIATSDPYVGVDRKTASTMMVQERNKFNANLEKRRTALMSQEKMLGRLNRFGQLMDSGMGTGPEKGEVLGMDLGSIAAKWDSVTAEGKAIQDEITPLMRQGMPGAASDRDVAMFRGATVGIGKPEETNRNIIEAVQMRTTLAQQKLEFDQDYFATNHTSLGADSFWKQYLEANPIFDPKAPMEDYKLNPNRKSYKEWFANPTASQSSPPETFPGTKREWDAMTPDQKAKF